jgi:hypothetical protein
MCGIKVIRKVDGTNLAQMGKFTKRNPAATMSYSWECEEMPKGRNKPPKKK